jgi:hypothetical protein
VSPRRWACSQWNSQHGALALRWDIVIPLGLPESRTVSVVRCPACDRPATMLAHDFPTLYFFCPACHHVWDMPSAPAPPKAV